MTTSRRILAFVVLVGLLALTPAAYASPPDQTWLPGLYDNADFDDVILFIAGNVGAVAPAVLWSLRPLATVVGLIVPASTLPPTVAPLSSGPSRAPPLA